MKYTRQTLFFSVIAIFLATALVTLLGVIGVLTIDPTYLNTLFSSLILELVVAVIGLFKATDWFGPSGTLPIASTIQGNWWQFIRQGRQNAISFIQITYSEDQQLVLQCNNYGKSGDRNLGTVYLLERKMLEMHVY